MKATQFFIFFLFSLVLASCVTAPVTEIPAGKGFVYLDVQLQGSRDAELIVYEVGGGIPAAKILVKKGRSIHGFFGKPGKQYEITRIRFDGRLGFVRPPVRFGNVQTNRINYGQSLNIIINRGRFQVQRSDAMFDRSKPLVKQSFPVLTTKYAFAERK